MPRLAPDTSPSLPAGRERWQTGIVHLGIGAFHRAHQAHFTQDAMLATGDDRWGILGVTQRSRGVVDQLRPQGGLYGLLVTGAQSESLHTIGTVLDAAFPGEETDRVLAAIAAPSTHVVSLTITEKGYCRRADGGLDVDRADVRADLDALFGSADVPARTGIGLLVRGLAARFRAGGGGLTVLPCDNLMDNGPTVAALVADALAVVPGSDELAGWVAEHVRFPATMVDRIVPATTPEHRARALAMSGLEDGGLVVAEPFRQWVIEDDFAGPRPAWERVGAQLTHAVGLYERTKLRLLNATHSMLAYRGSLAGLTTIAEAVATFGDEARALIDTDLIPTVIPPGVTPPADLDLAAYRDTVLDRFANPATGHRTIQVAMDGSQKLPIRLLAAARERIAAGQTPEHIAGVVGAWMAFVTLRRDVRGNALEVSDPLLPVIDAALAGDEAGRVHRLLSIEPIFGTDLAADEAFVAAATASYLSLT